MKAKSLLPVVAAIILALSSGIVLAGKSDLEKAGALYHPSTQPGDHPEVIDTPYFTLIPGTTFTYKSQDDEGTELSTVTVTNKTKKVMGITARVVWDRVSRNGELIEETYDWYAQDKAGNVGYLGEDSKEMEKGKIVSTRGSWEAGVDGAQPGIVMPAHATLGAPYRQEYKRGEAEDMGQIVSLSEAVKVPAGSYRDCIKTKDWSALETGNVEHKYYSREVGNVVLEAEGHDQKRVELIEVTKSER